MQKTILYTKITICLTFIVTSFHCASMQTIVDKYSQNVKLRQAAKNGDLKTVQQLLEDRKIITKIESRDENGLTSLDLASENNHPAVVRYLLQMKANVEGGLFWPPLKRAAEKGYLEIVKILVNNNASIDNTDNIATSLHLAIKENHPPSIAEFLLENKANVNAQDRKGVTPLCYAAQYCSIFTFLYLQQNEANIRHKDKKGNNIFHYAALGNNQRLMDILMSSYNFSIDTPNKDQETALHLVTEKGNSESIEYLLQNKGNPNSQDCHQRTPAHLVAKIEQKRTIPSTIRLLCKYNACLEIPDRKGNTPLQEATISLCPGMALSLLNWNANPFSRNCDGKTAWDLIKETELTRDVPYGFFTCIETQNIEKNPDTHEIRKLLCLAKQNRN